MHKKQYGKMTVSAWLSAEMERSNPVLMLTVGILLTVAGILVRCWIGSPYRTILELGLAEILPPVWLLTIVSMLWLFVLGCAAGFALGYRTGHREEKYRGFLFFLLLALVELCRYPLLFGANLVLLSTLAALLSLCLSLVVTCAFYRVTKFSGMLFLLHDVWQIYLLVLSFAILFRG